MAERTKEELIDELQKLRQENQKLKEMAEEALKENEEKYRLERKQAEMELEKTRQKAYQAERLASLGTMAAGFAHEINQPLNMIKMIVDGIIYWQRKGLTFEKDQIIKDLKAVSTHADRINLITKRIRIFAKNKHSPKLVRCNLNNAVEVALGIIGSQLYTHKIKLNKQLQKILPLIMGDKNLLEEIIINLIINAIHALNEINIEEKTIDIISYSENSNVILEITDNGTGISEKIKNKIFDPFFTTKTVGMGTGLGLFIVRSNVRLLNGQITYTNNKKGGATFILEFPVATGVLYDRRL